MEVLSGCTKRELACAVKQLPKSKKIAEHPTAEVCTWTCISAIYAEHCNIPGIVSDIWWCVRLERHLEQSGQAA